MEETPPPCKHLTSESSVIESTLLVTTRPTQSSYDVDNTTRRQVSLCSAVQVASAPIFDYIIARTRAEVKPEPKPEPAHMRSFPLKCALVIPIYSYPISSAPLRLQSHTTLSPLSLKAHPTLSLATKKQPKKTKHDLYRAQEKSQNSNVESNHNPPHASASPRFSVKLPPRRTLAALATS